MNREFEYYFNEQGTWNMRPINVDYDWKLVAELLNDLMNEMLK